MGTRTQTDVGWWMGFPWARGSAGFGVARTTRCTGLLEVTQLFFLFNCDDSFCSLLRLRGLLFTYSNFLFFIMPYSSTFDELLTATASASVRELEKKGD